MIRLNIGSDFVQIPGYINIDIRKSVNPDIVMDSRKLCFYDSSVEEINFGNTLEHMDRNDGIKSLKEFWRVLILNGVLFITIPLIDKAEECYRKGEIGKDRLDSIRFGEGNSYNSHKQEFRMGDLEQCLFETGFKSMPLDLSTFPYIVVSNRNNPKIDTWQYGVKAVKYHQNKPSGL